MSEAEASAAPAAPPATAPSTVTDVLGRVRPVARVYGNGAWDCPFCTYAIDPSRPCRGRRGGYAADCSGEVHCQNPACVANTHYPIEAARSFVEEQERRSREEARRKRDSEERARRDEEGRRARADRREALATEARERGACLRCALHDEATGRPAKFVKHRGPCPRDRRAAA